MTVWARDPGVLWRRSGDRVVLCPPGLETGLLLEGTGAIAWLLLDPPIDHVDLVAVLTESFDADRDTVDVEVAAFLAELGGLDAVVEG